MIPTTDLLITWIQTVRQLGKEELGRDLFEDPSPNSDDPAGALLLQFCFREHLPDGTVTSADSLRAWLHGSDEAAAFRNRSERAQVVPRPALPPFPNGSYDRELPFVPPFGPDV